MSFEIQFLGAAGTVTGSKYLLSYNGKKILMDCGLFQGLKNLRLKNWDKLLVKPSEIDSIILTHAHIDHSGFIPRLVKEGFRGKIYTTFATQDVCGILLPDCGYLLEEEAAYLNKTGHTKHNPALALFTYEDAKDSLKYFEGVAFKTKVTLDENFSFEFHYVGHILGAASVIIEINGKKIAFTGDVGRIEDKVLYPPEPLPQVDYLVTESTYGNRLHELTDPMDDLEKVVNETYARQGVLIIPAFAVGRAQTMMYYLSMLRKQKRIPPMPMYLNSPMATDFTAIFLKHKELHRLTEKECHFISETMQMIKTSEESKSLNHHKGPMIIISASGMVSGGRVLHHLKEFAPKAENTILLTGFQSAGTRGEALQNGVKAIKIHGEYVSVNAQVKVLSNMSSHADYGELINWFTQSKINPKKVFITHGESSAADDLRRRLTETFKWSCVVPIQGEKIQLVD